jgi:Lon protease-like protein
MFPLSVVLYPGAALPLNVFEPRYRRLTADCLDADREFGVVLISRGREVGGGDERVSVGTIATIEEAARFPDGRWALMARGTTRISVARWLADDPYPLAEVETAPATGWSGPLAVLEQAEAAVRQTRALLSELGDRPALAPGVSLGTTPEEIAWRLCAEAPVNTMDAQRLLETDDPSERMRVLGELARGLAEDLSRLLGQGRGG